MLNGRSDNRWVKRAFHLRHRGEQNLTTDCARFSWTGRKERGKPMLWEYPMGLWAASRRLGGGSRPDRQNARSPLAALAVALALVAIVAALDYGTGYEMRFAVLYLAPIALATWAAGVHLGILIVVLSSSCWIVSFRSAHAYSNELFFYWEGAVMVAAFIAFVYLLSRLRVALDRADERFVRVLEEMHAAVCVVDQGDGAVLYANRRLVRMLDSDSTSGAAIEISKRFGQSVGASASTTKSRHAEAATESFFSEEVRDQTNGRWYLVQTGPIPWSHDRRVSLKVITDISEQRYARVLKRQHQDVLHQTARLAALAEIASSLAHEINQPLMAIAGYNDACLRLLRAADCDKSELVKALEKSRGQAVHAGRIISRVRDFIRSRHPNPTQCGVNEVVEEALELMEARLEANAVSAKLGLTHALPPMQGDGTLLVQVVVNLIENAIDAMHACAPSRRELSVLTSRTEDGAIMVSVTDRGEGVSAAIGDRLYQPFVTTKEQGLGLGLCICRSVVEAYGGRLWNADNPGGGSSFHFTIPAESER